MKAAKLVKVPDSVSRGINGLAGAESGVKASTYQPLSVDPLQNGINNGMAGRQNPAVRPVVVKQTDYKDLGSGRDFRYQSRDTAKQSLAKISKDPGPRSPNPNDEGVGG